MLTDQQISQQIRSFVFSNFPASKDRFVDDTTSLLESGIVDSLGVLDIVSFLESEFGLLMNDDELIAENFDSIAALTSFVRSALEGRGTDGLPDSSLTAN